MTTNGTGENFKKHRKQAGLTRKDAATALGLSPNSVYFWESNRSFPKPELWDEVINLYDFDRDELIRLAGGKDSPRVRRYLAQQETSQPAEHEKNERRGRRIYLRSKPKEHKTTDKSADLSREQLPGQADLARRLADLEQKVAKLQDSMEIVERAKELMLAWNRFKNALE